MRTIGLLFVAVYFAVAVPAGGAEGPVRGVTLTELGNVHRYDANESTTGSKTHAQRIVDLLYQRGVRHIVLTPRATMTHPRSSEIVPMTPPDQRAEERRRYMRLIRYIHGKGMTVGMRPIFFVVDGDGNTPYLEKLPDGSVIPWWHGNILPESPPAWFESLKTYYDIYLPIAKYGQVSEFTLGAELYTMTVGIEDHRYYREVKESERSRYDTFKFGFPGQWLGMLQYVRSRVASDCRIMYDINFTDDKTGGPAGIEEFGGEFARWKYRLVTLANPRDPEQKKVWRNLVDFWKGLDAVGIDLYRSLASKNQEIPKDYGSLINLLRAASDRYATQIDNALFEVEAISGKRQKVILKEIGFRSVEKGFIDPFLYVGTGRGEINLRHQAAAYKAVFQSFWDPKWDWFGGIVFWDASVDPSRHGPRDTGFSFLGKPPTEEIVQSYFKD